MIDPHRSRIFRIPVRVGHPIRASVLSLVLLRLSRGRRA